MKTSFAGKSVKSVSGQPGIRYSDIRQMGPDIFNKFIVQRLRELGQQK